MTKCPWCGTHEANENNYCMLYPESKKENKMIEEEKELAKIWVNEMLDAVFDKLGAPRLSLEQTFDLQGIMEKARLIDMLHREMMESLILQAMPKIWDEEETK